MQVPDQRLGAFLQDGPQWQAMRDLEKGELRAALTPEQQVRFDQNAGPPPGKS